MNVALFKEDQLPCIDRREIFRYAGTNTPTDIENGLLDECLGELVPALVYRVVWDTYPVSINGELLNLGFTATKSVDLKKNLRDCKKTVLFAATVGFAPDRLSQKYSRISPVRALLAESIGNERIEALCDYFCSQFDCARTRFSPGYGDFSLSHQSEIIAVLDCTRKIGLTINKSLLLSPAKSVTALFGIYEDINMITRG